MKLANIRSISKIKAETLLEILKIEGPPFDPFKIIEMLPAKLDSDFHIDKFSYSGEIGLDDDNNPVIWINPLDHENRQRFTAAHEIGHLCNDIAPYLLGETDHKHCFQDDSASLRRDGLQEPHEFAANDFAARLLMPKKHILKSASGLIKKHNDESGSEAKIPRSLFVERMADIFKVSQQAMQIRLQNIGILSR